MKNTKRLYSLLFILSTTILSSCGFTIAKDFSDYVENDFCRTNIDAIKDARYIQIGQVKQVQPYKKTSDGNYTSDGVLKVYPFDTNLIYTLYATKDLNNGKDIMEIEDVTGEYIFNLHKLFDRHNYYLDKDGNLINNLKVINDNYGGDFISVDEELFDVLKSAVEITKFSDGKFNLFIGELSSFWDEFINKINGSWNYIEETIDPDHNEDSKNEIQKLKNNTPKASEIDDVLIFDEGNKKVKFNKYKNAEKVSISLGGIGKGYLSENIYQKLKNINKTNGAFYAGSSSILVMDKQAYGNSWSLSLSNPYGVYYSPVGQIKFNEKMSVSTSGSQINYYYTLIDGKPVLRHHIIDAESGYPNTEGYDEITMISKSLSSTVLDCLSTILINCKTNEIETYVTKIREHFNADLECVLYKKAPIDSSKKQIDIYLTKGFKKNESFIEYTGGSSASSIPCSYTYLDY